MKKIKPFLSITIIMVMVALTNSCTKDEQKDMEKPIISEEGITAMPHECDVYQRGSVIPFAYLMTDNEALGSYNISIHNNFDHHSHTGSTESCTLEPMIPTEKIPDNAWNFTQSFTIPANQKTYKARMDINIPLDIADGDYHFMITLIDNAGWKTLKKISIKIKGTV